MEDQDKPFVCSELGCGMQFTNEDHLEVHMRKHDMSLALNLSGTGMLSPGIGIFSDQTPTPTKFLKNLEEMGLFQELTKNPFDDSFKKAMDDTSEHNSSLQISLPVTDVNDLDTPQPPIPRITIGDEDAWSKGVERTKGTLSSIVPKKRKKFLRQQSMPTSTTSEDESEAVIGSSSMEIGSSHTEGGDSGYVHLEVLKLQDQVSSSVGGAKTMPIMSYSSPVAAVTSSVVGEPQVSWPKPQVQTVTQTLVQPVTQVPSSIQQHSQSQPIAQAVSHGTNQAPNQGNNQGMVQVLLQLANGLTVPIQVPAANIVSPKQTALTSRPVFQSTMPVQKPPQVMQTVSQNPAPLIVTGNQHILQNMQQGTVLNPQPAINKPPAPQSTLPTTVRTLSLGNNQVVPLGINQGAPVQTQNVQNVISNVMNNSQQNIGADNQSGFKTIMIQQNSGFSTAGIQPTKVSPPRVNLSQKKVQSGSQSYTKQRLKAALQQQQASQKSSTILPVNEIKQEQRLDQDSVSMVSSSGSISSPEDRHFNLNSGNQDTIDPNEDPETRRQKFLERNRRAAAKCRQKRKYWITNLESKADELSNQNSKLCNEVKSLRGEVAHLKTLLIAHKDCPVTKQQRLNGQIKADTFKVDQLKDKGEPSIIHIIEDPSHTTNPSTLPNTFITNSMDMAPIASSTNSSLQNVISVNSLPVNNHTPGVNVIPVSNSVHAVNGSIPATSQFVTLPRFVTVNPSSVQDTPTTISVITGPNSIGLLPKLFNFEQIVQNHTNQTS